MAISRRRLLTMPPGLHAFALFLIGPPATTGRLAALSLQTMDPTQHMQWIGDADRGHLRLLDQTRLPAEEVWLDCLEVEAVFAAIRRLAVRGAPAIGIAAAYGCILAAQGANTENEAGRRLAAGAAWLAESRPTAVNLFWALRRMQAVTPPSPANLLAEARAIHEQDAAMCRRIGENGLSLIERAAAARGGGRPVRILTHCNAGALATGGVGTATAPMYLAHQRGVPIAVYADETRPLLQGARLTAFELSAAGIAVRVICDSAAAMLMRAGEVDMVITGTDRIAANGDVANKIGTYALAVLARHHGAKMMVVAPGSTLDPSMPDGSGITIEERDPGEIWRAAGIETPPAGHAAWNPVFDVTPAGLVDCIVTENGVFRPPYDFSQTD